MSWDQLLGKIPFPGGAVFPSLWQTSSQVALSASLHCFPAPRESTSFISCLVNLSQKLCCLSDTFSLDNCGQGVCGGTAVQTCEPACRNSPAGQGAAWMAAVVQEAQEQLAQVCSACLGKHACLWSEQSSYLLILLLLLVSAQSKPCSPRMWFSYSTVLSAGFAGMDSPKCTC